MNLKEILTDEELQDCERHEGLFGEMDPETVIYNLRKHYKELPIEITTEITKTIILNQIYWEIVRINEREEIWVKQ